MTTASIILLLVTLQRLSELVIARRNTAGLVAKGAVEHGASHYPVMVLLHASWLAGLWYFGWNATVIWPLMTLYIALQGFRIWILATLGSRWTTRILTVPMKHWWWVDPTNSCVTPIMRWCCWKCRCCRWRWASHGSPGSMVC